MRTPLSLFLAAVTALVTVGGVAVEARPASAEGDFAVLQMNLCLSGVAGCYPRTSYPAVVDEAAAQVVDHAPEVVTLNEACSGDVATMARRTGYHLRFAAVRDDGARLPCVKPSGRGVFGIAILTRAPITASQGRAFAAQAGPEERRWICASTAQEVTACTAHLSQRGSAAQEHANDAECGELRDVLARYDDAGTTVFGGDVNRQTPCAPADMWATEDTAARQASGIQHVYGSRSLAAPVARVAAARYTDHDFLLAAGR